MTVAPQSIQPSNVEARRRIATFIALDVIAQIIWKRFAASHHIEWADETHRAEYIDTAREILTALTAPIDLEAKS